MLCEYGCGKEATYKFKNGKWCCSEETNKCTEVRRKSSEKRKGIKRSLEICEKIRKKCINRKLTDAHIEKIRLKSMNRKHSFETKEKIRISNTGKVLSYETKEKIINSLKGRPSKNKGKTLSDEIKIKFRNSHLGKKLTEDQKNKMRGKIPWNKNKFHSEESKLKMRLSHLGKIPSEKCKNINRQRLLNGQALKMIKAIKKISNEEIKIRNMVKELYSSCEFQYGIFNYSLDIAIPEHKIAIEYDGYYHFEDIKNKVEKEYYKIRRQKIENEGWKFLRYTMFDKFPTIEKIKEDILKLK